jgi:2-dehydro-3-deoxy-D-gluconate 5-dehydrogenase
MNDLFSLNGKKAIITGAASGLGRAMAESLYSAGAEICIIDISDKLDGIVKEIQNNSQKAYGVKCDLSNRKELKAGFEDAVKKLGGLDIIINDAGTIKRHKAEVFPVEDWDLVIELNLTSVFLLCQMAGNIMLQQGHGKIINVASLLSFVGGMTVPAYAASKGGIAQLTKAFANEWGNRGLNVNAIAPGFMATQLNQALQGNPDREPQILGHVPAGRWGKPEDLKGAAVFLASNASDFVNGVILPVDGGYLAR